jgi:hypothetical protein
MEGERKMIKITKRDTIWGIIGLIVLIGLGLQRGIIYSSNLNSSGKLSYAVIYDKSRKYYFYEYWVNGMIHYGRFGNSGKSNVDVGDSIIVQYYTLKPVQHVIFSMDAGQLKRIKELKPKRVSVWEAM